MYLDFYQLKKEPFQISSDAEFLFLSPSHKEALAAIMYGIEHRNGAVEVIGEVGVGKTTVLHSYLKSTKPDNLKILCIPGVIKTELTFKELMKIILRECQSDPETDDVTDMIYHLRQVLEQDYNAGLKSVLIIDEAQNLSVEALENLRILSNLEVGGHQLLQIVLLGQPELDRKLRRRELRQLRQCIAVRATIAPLTQPESLDYINYRLSQVATTGETIFTKTALQRLIKQARGIPRVLNILCDNALIAGFGHQQKPISVDIVKEVISDIKVRRLPSISGPRLAYTAGCALLAGFLGFLVSKLCLAVMG